MTSPSRRHLYWFAVFLVLFEFGTYSANDMIMPGTLHVVREFNGQIRDVANSLTFYMLGCALLQLPMGLLASRFGNRVMLLIGNVLFLLFTVFLLLSRDLQGFMVGRALQGSCMAFISLGYTLIHAHFDDKQAIQITAMMANVTMLAPLIGPAIGATIIQWASWRAIFGISAVIGLIALIGLYHFIPVEQASRKSMNLRQVVQAYYEILRRPTFIAGACSVGFISSPFILWIAASPSLLMVAAGRSMHFYVLAQVIVMSGLLVSSILLHRTAGKVAFKNVLWLAISCALLGLVIAYFGLDHMTLFIGGLFLMVAGMGFMNTTIYRIIATLKVNEPNLIFPLLGFIHGMLMIVSMYYGNIQLNKAHYSLHCYMNWSSKLFFLASVSTFCFIRLTRNRKIQMISYDHLEHPPI